MELVTALAKRLLQLPPVELLTEAEKVSPTALGELARELDGLAAHATLVATVAANINNGQTDRKRNARQANTKRRQVRRVLGYQVSRDVPLDP